MPQIILSEWNELSVEEQRIIIDFLKLGLLEIPDDICGSLPELQVTDIIQMPEAESNTINRRSFSDLRMQLDGMSERSQPATSLGSFSALNLLKEIQLTEFGSRKLCEIRCEILYGTQPDKLSTCLDNCG